LLTGDEQIRVRGVNVAVQKDAEQQKRLQFLQITGNPIDAPIVGVAGRAKILRSLAQDLGLPDDIVPDDATIAAIQKQQQQQAAQQQAMGGQGGPPGPPGQPGSHPGGAPGQPGAQPSPAAQAQGAQPPHPTPARLSDAAPPQNSFQQQPGVLHS
jgi:hypothetical protein